MTKQKTTTAVVVVVVPLLLLASSAAALQQVNRRQALGAAATQVGQAALGGTALVGAATLSAVPAAALAASVIPERIQLGQLGIGAWAWGDTLFWGYDQKKDEELRETFDFIAKSAKVGFIDTAELYGLGRSETLIGGWAGDLGGSFKTPIATKFAALPWKTSARDVVQACEASLSRLNREKIDLYQIHFPNGWSNEQYWDGLAECVDRGLVKSVGVSNYGSEAVRAVHARLASRGIPLASNQIQYSLLYRYPEQNGLLKTCKDLNVDVLAYSPLGLGLLTGKFTRENGQLPSGPRAQLFKTYLADDRYVNLQETMSRVAAKHGAVDAAVALNWCRAKGTIPIAGARNLKQATQNVQALDWELSTDELAAVDAAANNLPWLGLTPPFADKDVFTGMKMFDS